MITLPCVAYDVQTAHPADVPVPPAHDQPFEIEYARCAAAATAGVAHQAQHDAGQFHGSMRPAHGHQVGLHILVGPPSQRQGYGWKIDMPAMSHVLRGATGMVTA